MDVIKSSSAVSVDDPKKPYLQNNGFVKKKNETVTVAEVRNNNKGLTEIDQENVEEVEPMTSSDFSAHSSSEFVLELLLNLGYLLF